MVLLTRPLHMTTLIYPHRCKNLQSLVTSATTPQSSFDFDDLFGLGLSAAPVPTPSPPLLKLNPRAALDPGAFQQKWHQLPILLTQVCLSPQLSTCDPIHETIVYISYTVKFGIRNIGNSKRCHKFLGILTGERL